MRHALFFFYFSVFYLACKSQWGKKFKICPISPFHFQTKKKCIKKSLSPQFLDVRGSDEKLVFNLEQHNVKKEWIFHGFVFLTNFAKAIFYEEFMTDCPNLCSRRIDKTESHNTGDKLTRR